MLFRVTFLLLFFILSAFSPVFSQSKNQPIKPSNTEVSDLIQHLPDYENVKNQAKYISNSVELKKNFSEESVVDLIDFSGGTETVSADYEQGRLLIKQMKNSNNFSLKIRQMPIIARLEIIQFFFLVKPMKLLLLLL
jgi:hypothetical protein